MLSATQASLDEVRAIKPWPYPEQQGSGVRGWIEGDLAFGLNMEEWRCPRPCWPEGLGLVCMRVSCLRSRCRTVPSLAPPHAPRHVAQRNSHACPFGSPSTGSSLSPS